MNKKMNINAVNGGMAGKELEYSGIYFSPSGSYPRLLYSQTDLVTTENICIVIGISLICFCRGSSW